MIHQQTKSAWKHFKFLFPYTSELPTCAEELYFIMLFLASSMRNGFFTTLLITAVYTFTSFKRLIQCNNHRTNKHDLNHRGCSDSELDIHHDLFLCAKNPGHEKFFPISKFRLTDLPEGFQFTDIVKLIDLVSNLVVKITLDDVSTGRPRGSIFDLNHSNEDACSYGSGYLWNAQCCQWHRDVACPCRKCRNRRTTDWGELRIVTANHVVFDDTEAKGATIELFYNDPHDVSSVTQLVGLRVVDSDMEGDRCEMIAIVHDRPMWDLLVQGIEYCYNPKRVQGAIENLTVQRGKNYLTVIISHPHGSSKQVTVGRCLKRHVSESGTPLLQRIKYDYDTPTCPGSSGAPVLVFGCERHTVSFAPHARWDHRRKRNASGHAIELEHSDFWADPPVPRTPFKLRTILSNKHISKSQKVKLLCRKCRTWIVARCRELVSWLNLDRMFDFRTKKNIGTLALNSSPTTLQDSLEPVETYSDTRTYQDSNQWQSVRARACAKQKHEKFIPFNTFSLNNLPPGYQDENIVKAVRYLGILTGKLTVLPGNRSGATVQGTCHLRYFDSRLVLEKPDCPCPKCKTSGRPPSKWATFIASSAAHVMEKFKDGKLYVCELLYDDEEHPENVRKLYGQSILKFDLDNDSCDFELVTHDMELCALINKTLKDFWRSVGQLENRWLSTTPPYLVVIPSHPHGLSKHVTVGLTVDDDTDTNSDTVTCPVSDGPVPGNQNTGNDVLSLIGISKVISYDDIFPQQGIFGLNKGTPTLSTDTPTPSADTPTCTDTPRLSAETPTPSTDITTSNTGISTPCTEISTPNTGISTPSTEISTPNTDIPTQNREVHTPNDGMSSANGGIPSPNAEISSQNWKSPPRPTLNSRRQYKYTNATCPGSAGAPLFILKGDRILNVYSVHSGSRHDLYNMSSFTVDVNDVFAHLVKTPYIENI